MFQILECGYFLMPWNSKKIIMGIVGKSVMHQVRCMDFLILNLKIVMHLCFTFLYARCSYILILACKWSDFNIIYVLGDSEKVCKCITAGLFPNAAYLHYSGVYRTVRGDQELYIHPTSVLYTLEQPKWYVEKFHSSKIYKF